MSRVLSFLLAFALLYQASWAMAASFCEHEVATRAVMHFGHHAHAHAVGDGKQPAGGGKLAVDSDCGFHHAGHPAVVDGSVSSMAAPALRGAFIAQARGLRESVPRKVPDRPQWPRLA